MLTGEGSIAAEFIENPTALLTLLRVAIDEVVAVEFEVEFDVEVEENRLLCRPAMMGLLLPLLQLLPLPPLPSLIPPLPLPLRLLSQIPQSPLP
jgi:hypothetical protein